MKKILLGLVAAFALASFAAPARAEGDAAGDKPADAAPAKKSKKSKKAKKGAEAEAPAGDTAAPAGDKK